MNIQTLPAAIVIPLEHSGILFIWGRSNGFIAFTASGVEVLGSVGLQESITNTLGHELQAFIVTGGLQKDDTIIIVAEIFIKALGFSKPEAEITSDEIAIKIADVLNTALQLNGQPEKTKS